MRAGLSSHSLTHSLSLSHTSTFSLRLKFLTISMRVPLPLPVSVCVWLLLLAVLKTRAYAHAHALSEGVTERLGDAPLPHACNIKKVHVESIESMGNIIKQLPEEPVVFVGAPTRNHILAQAASKEALRELHGSTVVTLASSNTYSHDTIDMTLSQYLDLLERDAHLSPNAKANETYYLFGNNFSELFKQLEALYVLPPCTHCKTAGATTLGIGGLRSGVAFHFHGPGFAEVISGRKQFFLYPPGMNINVPVPPNLTMSQWVQEIYPTVQRRQLMNPAYNNKSKDTTEHASAIDPSHAVVDGNIYDTLENQHDRLDSSTSNVCNGHESSSDDAASEVVVPPSEFLHSFYECVLEPGDMLYFPNSWQHATLNLDDYNLFVSVFLDLQLMRR